MEARRQTNVVSPLAFARIVTALDARNQLIGRGFRMTIPMNKLRAILSLTVGAFVGWIVFHWPVGPIWNRPDPERCAIVRFMPDDSTLLTAHGTQWGSSGKLSPRVCRWNVDSGELLSSLEIPFDAGNIRQGVNVDIMASPDGKTLMTCCTRKNAAGGSDREYCLHDAATGVKRWGPIPEVMHFNPGSCSPDGRMLWTFHGTKPKPWDGFDIFDMATGNPILQLRSQADEKGRGCCFSPDNASITVLWQTKTPEGSNSSIRVLDLPDGKERFRCELPTKVSRGPKKWEGNRLYFDTSERDGNSGWVLNNTVSFDIAGDRLGPMRAEPLLHGHSDGLNSQSYYNEGVDWIAQIHSGQATISKMQAWYNWLRFKVGGIKPPSVGGTRLKVDIFDKCSGKLRFQLPEIAGDSLCISPDGSKIAAVDKQLGLCMWNANLFPRWPLSLAAGLFATGFVALAGRAWTRRTKRPAVSS